MPSKGKVIINLNQTIGTINPAVYGHFIEHLGRCIYPGIWVGENSETPNDKGLRRDVVEALGRISLPVMRWPGGCFADHYHWGDGVGPRGHRPVRVNITWGGEEPNAFGTDEFLYFCSRVGAEPYICLNVGSGSVSEASSWVEYCNYAGSSSYAQLRAEHGVKKPHHVRYWGVGNENWGCGGDFDPVYYAWEYRRYACFLKRVDPSIQLIACGHTTRDWNLRFMECLKDHIHLIDHLSIHHYFGGHGGDIDFTDEQYYSLLGSVQDLEYQLQQAIAVVDFFAEGRKDIGIIVDEWGTWYPQATVEKGLFQQNTVRDAILAASVLNLFNNYSRKVAMANLAQTVNVLQSLILTEGSQTVLTPTYHVFDMYKAHMGNTALAVDVDSPTIMELRPPTQRRARAQRVKKPMQALDISASLRRGENQLVLTLVNQHLTEEVETDIVLEGNLTVEKGEVTVLTAENVRAHNDFNVFNRVKPKHEGIEVSGKTFTYTAPAHSVNTLVIRLK